MSQITIVNNSNVDWLNNAQPIEYPLYSWTAKFHITYWLAEIAEVVLDGGHSKTVATSTAATLKAFGMNDSNPTAELDINVGTQNIAIATGSNNTIQFLIGPTAGKTTADTLTLKNQCPFPVIFELTAQNAPSQSWTVPPNADWPVLLAMLFTAYAHVHGYPNEPSNGYDTPLVGFSDPNATLTLVPEDASKKFQINVS